MWLILLVGPSSIPSYRTGAPRLWSCLHCSPNTSVSVCGMFSSPSGRTSFPSVLLSSFQNLVFNIWFQGCTPQLVTVIALAHLQHGYKVSSFFLVQHHLILCLSFRLQSHSLFTVISGDLLAISLRAMLIVYHSGFSTKIGSTKSDF